MKSKLFRYHFKIKLSSTYYRKRAVFQPIVHNQYLNDFYRIIASRPIISKSSLVTSSRPTCLYTSRSRACVTFFYVSRIQFKKISTQGLFYGLFYSVWLMRALAVFVKFFNDGFSRGLRSFSVPVSWEITQVVQLLNREGYLLAYYRDSNVYILFPNYSLPKFRFRFFYKVRVSRSIISIASLVNSGRHIIAYNRHFNYDFLPNLFIQGCYRAKPVLEIFFI